MVLKIGFRTLTYLNIQTDQACRKSLLNCPDFSQNLAEISISRTTHQLLWTQVSNIQVDEPREEQNQVCCYKQNLKPIHCLTPDEENSMSFFDPAACFTDGPKGLPKSAQSVKYAVLSDADSTSIDYVNQVEKAKDPSPSGYANRSELFSLS